jgi:hypothetical protein
VQAGDVRVDQPHLHRATALDAGEGQVAADRDVPWHVDPGQLSEQAARLVGGVGRDAEHIAGHIAARRAGTADVTLRTYVRSMA